MVRSGQMKEAVDSQRSHHKGRTTKALWIAVDEHKALPGRLDFTGLKVQAIPHAPDGRRAADDVADGAHRVQETVHRVTDGRRHLSPPISGQGPIRGALIYLRGLQVRRERRVFGIEQKSRVGSRFYP